MQTLWRKIFSLLRQYPILWLPMILAALASSALNQLVYPLVRRLIFATSVTHSVLGGAPIPVSPGYLKTLIIALPFNLALDLIALMLSIAALLATASILQNPGQRTGQFHNAISYIKSSQSRALSLSLKFFLVQFVFLPINGYLALPLTLALDNLQGSLERSLNLSLKSCITLENLNLPSYFAGRSTLLPYAIVAIFFFAPAAVRLLQPRDSIARPNQARKARIAATTIAATYLLIDFVVPFALRPIYQSLPTGSRFILVPIVATTTAIIRALPTVPLFVASTIIANPADSAATPDELPITPSPPESPPPSTFA